MTERECLAMVASLEDILRGKDDEILKLRRENEELRRRAGAAPFGPVPERAVPGKEGEARWAWPEKEAYARFLITLAAEAEEEEANAGDNDCAFYMAWGKKLAYRKAVRELMEGI